jgi:hypothetical protein
MANLSITAANVVPVDGYGFVDTVAGATITRGTPCYESATNGQSLICDANDTALKATVKGIALQDAAAGQPLRLMVSGNLGLGAILTVGTVYCLSATAGAICPYADLTTNDYVTILGVATTTSNLQVRLVSAGIAKP